jgi:hypothetical protein
MSQKKRSHAKKQPARRKVIATPKAINAFGINGGSVEKINYSVTIQIAGGPSIPIAGALEVDAYEKIDLTVPAKQGAVDGSAVVTVSPGVLADIRLLVLTASSKDGSLKFKTSAAGALDVPITGPLTLIGGTACSLFGTVPDKLTFTNTAATAASVTILVGRKAV